LTYCIACNISAEASGNGEWSIIFGFSLNIDQKNLQAKKCNVEIYDNQCGKAHVL
jgi:hypothetical protein